MGPIDYLDVTYEKVLADVEGPVWDIWRRQEPVLLGVESLRDVRLVRGTEADQLLGGLVRLAAQAGRDDSLAARAVAHQVAGEARGVAIELRDLGPEVDRLVLGSLWIAIKEFPVQRRTRAFATSLRRQTRRLTLQALRETDNRVVSLAAVTADTPVIAGTPPSEIDEASGAREELVDFLQWCVASDRITGEDAALVMELVAAGWGTSVPGVRPHKRGVCTLLSIGVVAEQHGTCAKTVIRRRDRVLAALRDAAVAYIRDVA